MDSVIRELNFPVLRIGHQTATPIILWNHADPVNREGPTTTQYIVDSVGETKANAP